MRSPPRVDLIYKGKEYRLISRKIKTPQEPTPPEKERSRTPNEAWTEDQAMKLISSADDLFDRTILILGFNSGLRVSEISSIDTGMIDEENNRIKVWDEKKDRHRQVYIGSSAMSAVRLYMKEKNVKGPKLFDCSWKKFERHLQKISGRVLNDPRSWHTVRHTYVTLCAKRHIDPKVVCENTGDSLEVIMEVYNNPSLEIMKANAEVVLPVDLNSLDLAPGPQLDYKANVEKLRSGKQ